MPQMEQILVKLPTWGRKVLLLHPFVSENNGVLLEMYNCVITEKRLLKMNKSDGLCKLCECDSEDLMHVL